MSETARGEGRAHAHPLSVDDARERALDAADRLFYTNGIQAVGMDQLREASGVSLKRLYSFFPSKNDIIEQVLLRRHEMWTTGLAAAVATATDARGRLLAVYDYLFEWFDEDDFRGCAFINSFGELGAVSPRVATIVREHKSDFQAYVASLVREAGAPASLAPQLAILAEGAQTTAAIAGTSAPAADARAAAETLIAVALGTIHPRRPNRGVE